ncbi:MAG: hypothetical protein GY699_25515, partial [Desulfobacteraceae bacterium]|nr:hypothetical protein [Desulfobacteraceae bacterium]
MKRKVLSGFCLLLFLVLFMGSTSFAVPAQINYQGVLEDAGGPLTGTTTMIFRLFDVETNGSEPLWEETQDVSVDQGIYSVILGTGTISPSYGGLADALLLNDNLWLEVQVSGETLSPRQKITSVGFAIRAGTVSDGAITETKLAANAVTTEKLADGSVTASKVTGGPDSGLNADQLDGKSSEDFGAASVVNQNQTDIAALQAEIQALKDLLAGVTRSNNNIYFTGVNVHVRDGSGGTDGTVNGLGNLIVGYNELRDTDNDRTGSHNLVVGRANNYSSYGGFVVGYYSEISGDYASVSGGFSNTASGDYASVSGGVGNTASGYYSSVSGGNGNTATFWVTSVSGGSSNTASGDYASVSGGIGNTASGDYASVSGGDYNTASGYSASVSGGFSNTASSNYASVSGGSHNTASGDYATTVGGYNNDAIADYVTVLGWRDVSGSQADYGL